MSREENRQQWLAYLGERCGTYEYRTLRYAAVWDCMNWADGVEDTDLIVDVGAGMCDFDRYLRQTQNYKGRYLPIDGCIDGTNLEFWCPTVTADFFVSIEVMEHLRNPVRMLKNLQLSVSKKIVITTPNPRVVDVLSLDRTHYTPIHRETLEDLGFHVEAMSLFGAGDDTLLAYWKPGDSMCGSVDYTLPERRRRREVVHPFLTELENWVYGVGENTLSGAVR